MSYRMIGGVQSVPRVMRGAPVIRPGMFDVPLMERDLGAAEIGSMSNAKIGLLAVAAAGLVYYLRKRR